MIMSWLSGTKVAILPSAANTNVSETLGFKTFKFMLLCLTISAGHATLYGTSGSMGRPSKLYEINTTTGRATFIGTVKVNSLPVSINGLAFDRTNRELGGKMYAHTSPLSPNFPNSLITLNLENGNGELIGQSQLPGMADLAIDNFGTVYGMNRGTNPNQPIDDLAKFDLSDARARLFGDSNLTLGNFGMDFDRVNNDKLHLVNFVDGAGVYFTLSVANGLAKPVRAISNAEFECGFGTINPDGFAFGMEYWCPEVANDGGININSRIQIIWLPFGTKMTTIQTQVTDLTAMSFTFETTEAPSVSPSQAPSGEPSAIPSLRPSLSPSSTPTQLPSTQPSLRPSLSPSSAPTQLPSTHPSVQPSRRPSTSPTSIPSEKPSAIPSASPIVAASSVPSAAPSASPTTGQPTNSPSQMPSLLPTAEPSSRPSRSPSQNPTVFGSAVPTLSPAPSSKPSTGPSSLPTEALSFRPSANPSAEPSPKPSPRPNVAVSQQPSSYPSARPTSQPTSNPSGQPTGVPSNPPTIAPTVDPCTTNQCTILFVIPGRWVRSEYLGTCIERCAVLTDLELALGSRCGRCP